MFFLYFLIFCIFISIPAGTNSVIDNYGMFFTKTLGGLACLNNPWSDLCDIWTGKLYDKILKSARYHKWLRDENSELSEKVQRWSK